MTGPSLGSDRRLHAGLVVMFFSLVYNISLLVVLTLNFFLFEPKIVLVLRLTRLSSSRRFMSIGFTSADLASQRSSCLCQDYNILLLFKRDILYTGNVEYILLCLCLKQKIIKINLNRHSQIYNNHEHLVISLEKFSSFNGNLAHEQQISQLFARTGSFLDLVISQVELIEKDKEKFHSS